MDLMPHIKALLDDLINMTKNITVKRSDLAREDEDKSLSLYYQYLQVLEGETSFESFFSYPKYVLSKYTKWIKQDNYDYNFGSPVPLLDSKDIIKNIPNDRIVTFSTSMCKNDIDNIGKPGDGWVQYTGQNIFCKINDNTAQTKDFSFQLYETDDFGNLIISKSIPSIKLDGKDISDLKNRVLYIYDNEFNEFVQVEVFYKGEYTLYDPNTFNDNSEWIPYIDGTIENSLFVINHLHDGKYIKYDSTNPSFVGSDKYYYRYKLYLRHIDDRRYNSYSYKLNGSEVKESETREGFVPYFKSSEDLYVELFKESPIGDYFYDERNEYFRSVYDVIEDEDLQHFLVNNIQVFTYDSSLEDYVIYESGAEGPYYRIHPSSYKGNRYNRVSDTEDIYYLYYDSDAWKINNYLMDNNDPSSWKYSISDTNNTKIYYNYGEDPDILHTNTCMFNIEVETSEDKWVSVGHPIKDVNGEHIEEITVDISTDIQRYYLYQTDNSEERQYRPVLDNNDNILYFVKDSVNGSYKVSTTRLSPTDTPYMFNNTEINVYKSERIFSQSEIYSYNKDKHSIPEEYREDLSKLMVKYIINKYCPTKYNQDYEVPIYYGELNNYYRTLNGLPPVNINVVPKIDRTTFNSYYTGNNKICNLYELTDAEILLIENNGILDKYKENYPTATYLWYLGHNRIDVVEAREAAPYDILRIGEVDMGITRSMFDENYKIAKNYVLTRQYFPNMFGDHEYYHAYIGFIICILAMILCMTKSGDILIQNKFMDQKTVDNILRSFGFNGTFDKVPFVYRRNIARNLYSLIRNKGIDSIYEKVISIFNIDADVYKYYFKRMVKRNPDGSLASNDTYEKLIAESDINDAINSDNLYVKENDTYRKCTPNECKDYSEIIDSLYKKIKNHSSDIVIAQSPIDSENIIKDINNDSNMLDYDDITNNDIYWGVYQSKDSLKKEIENTKFNYMDSKYVTLNNRFSLTELNFNSSYLLNYLLEATKYNKNESIYIGIDELENPQLIQNLIVTLFAIQAIKFGFDGNIPNDIISTAEIYKFNLDTEITDETSGKIKKIVDYYLDYITQSAAISVNDISNEIKEISNSTSGSIKSPIYNNKNDNNITSIVKTYMKNISKDNSLTIADENSLYNKLIALRDNAKTISDFRCFNDLLTCISVCNETNKAYSLDNPIWEPMYTVSYTRNKNTYTKDDESERIYYVDVRKSWDLLPYNDKVEFIQSHTNTDEYYKLIDNSFIRVDDYDSDIHEIIDNTIYYQPFINIDSSIKVSTKVPGINDYENIDYVICIHDLTRKEIIETPLTKIINKIDVYKKSDMLDSLNYRDYITTLLQNDIYKTSIQKPIDYVSLGINNTAYIGNITIDNFTNLGYVLNGPVFYVECIKDTNSIDDVYKLTIYRKTETALSYSMYLREKAPELYSYIQPVFGESDIEYKERINEFYSSIIATIEDNIESDKIKDDLNLSYVDFSNVSRYIKLIINVFKSYTVDLASMDTIYTIDDKSYNRIKFIEDYYTKEKVGVKSNFHVSDIASTKEEYYNKDIIKIKDELHIEQYSRKYYENKEE